MLDPKIKEAIERYRRVVLVTTAKEPIAGAVMCSCGKHQIYPEIDAYKQHSIWAEGIGVEQPAGGLLRGERSGQ